MHIFGKNRSLLHAASVLLVYPIFGLSFSETPLPVEPLLGRRQKSCSIHGMKQQRITYK
ncbi:hypothetical protein D932_00402 [Enterococcus casseliflavus 14-MB-W-14]|nr:hypothetical protein D932_00402 [Enterococcus casseliflavus 14-MB-W-14]